MKNNDRNITLCLKNCGIDISTPLSVVEGLHLMILSPLYKHKYLKEYCEENKYDYAIFSNNVIFR